MRKIELNPGAQFQFVTSDALHSAYMGGRGSGKTLSLVVRGLIYANQPKIPGESPPTGCLLADSFPHLKDIVYPVMYKVLNMAGYTMGKGRNGVVEVKNQSDRKFILPNGAEILMRSLDDPDRIRGLTLAWFGIDEGRMFDSAYAYTTLADCLRQGNHPDPEIDANRIWVPGENYKQAGFVTSTPNGYDWQWRLFSPESDKRLRSAELFMGSLLENRRHLPASFIDDITHRHTGLMYKQEVLGEFTGTVGGAVWPMFDPRKHVDNVDYDPESPLYAGWDFGIGDAGVIVFAQIEWEDVHLYDGSIIQKPKLRILDVLEETDKTIPEWANLYWQWLDKHTGGKPPTQQWGDPAGIQRQSIAGKSVYAALQDHGIYVAPAPRRPIDEAVVIIQNLMNRDDAFIINKKAGRGALAVQTYKWKIDEEGRRLSDRPVHDWTSHICDALRYLAVGAIGLSPRRSMRPTEQAQRGTMGYVLEQLLSEDEGEVLMDNAANSGGGRELAWHPDQTVGLDGLL